MVEVNGAVWKIFWSFCS